MRAHPRVGGENEGYEAISPVAPGSSPRRRGKPLGPAPKPENPRLIPA